MAAEEVGARLGTGIEGLLPLPMQPRLDQLLR